MQPQDIKSHFLSTLFSRGFIHDCTDLEGLDIVLKDNMMGLSFIGLLKVLWHKLVMLNMEIYF